MDFWNHVHDLPTFWTAARTWGLGFHLLGLAAISLPMLLVSQFGARDKRFQRRDDAGMVLGFLAIVSAMVWLAMWMAQSGERFEYVRVAAVDYVEANYDVVALGPVELDNEGWPSAGLATSAEFDAVTPKGAVKHVVVTWLPADTQAFSEGAALPKSMEWVQVELRSGDQPTK